jgi:plastocyanin
MVLLALVSVLVIALLAACSGGTVGGTPARAGGGTGGKSYNVTATEFQFAPNKFDAKVGQKLTFKVTNKGTVEHNFVILSPDGSQAARSQPGETKTLEFTPTEARLSDRLQYRRPQRSRMTASWQSSNCSDCKPSALTEGFLLPRALRCRYNQPLPALRYDDSRFAVRARLRMPKRRSTAA